MAAWRICTRLQAFARRGETRGTVHSVFAHAANLLFDGRLVTILDEPRSLVPYGCTIRKDLPFGMYGLRQGAEATLTPDGVSSADLRVDWTDAAAVDLSVEAIGLRKRPEGALDCASVLAVLREYPPDDGISSLATDDPDGLYAAFLRPRMPELYAAFCSADEQAAVRAVRRIAGCGIGLTPSSDDLLTGYFAAVHMLCIAGRADGGLRTMLPCVAAAAAERTNAVSGAFLLESGEGLFSLDFLELLGLLFSGADSAAIDRWSRRVASFGSTSGRDMLTGLVLAIQHHDGGKNSG